MPGNANEFGLTQGNALNISANSHSVSAEAMIRDLNALIADMEQDVNAQGGAALTAFQTAKASFIEAYNALAGKYGMSALAQDATNTDGVTTDDTNVGGFTSANGALPGIKPTTIAI
jgi:hypothetical protein